MIERERGREREEERERERERERRREREKERERERERARAGNIPSFNRDFRVTHTNRTLSQHTSVTLKAIFSPQQISKLDIGNFGWMVGVTLDSECRHAPADFEKVSDVIFFELK